MGAFNYCVLFLSAVASAGRRCPGETRKPLPLCVLQYKYSISADFVLNGLGQSTMDSRPRRPTAGIPPARYGYEETEQSLDPFKRTTPSVSNISSPLQEHAEREGAGVGPPVRAKPGGSRADGRENLGAEDPHQVLPRREQAAGTPRTARSPELETGPGSTPGRKQARDLMAEQRALEAADQVRRENIAQKRAAAMAAARNAATEQIVVEADIHQAGTGRRSRSGSRRQSNSSSIHSTPPGSRRGSGGRRTSQHGANDRPGGAGRGDSGLTSAVPLFCLKH